MNEARYYFGSLYKIHLTLFGALFEKNNGAMKKAIQYLDFLK